MMSGKPKKVAILGGGVGSMAAAFELTQEPDWQQKYDITVYQLGWRLGGKGASGRNQKLGARIQEHGLHIWAGYYDNSFRVMRECYAALNRAEPIPIRTVEEAFRGVNQVYLADFVDDRPHFWRVDFPTNKEVTGSGGVLLTPRDYLVELLEGLKELVSRFPLGQSVGEAGIFSGLPAPLASLLHGLQSSHRTTHVHAAAALAKALPKSGPNTPLHTLLHWLLHEFQQRLPKPDDRTSMNPTLAAVVAALEIGSACAKGIIQDKVLERGFDPLDDMEWTQWVMMHGASRKAMETSVGRSAYDYVFGSRGGIPTFAHRAVAAGTAMRALLRLLFTYKGSLFYKLNAGMGDIVFAPIYEVLHRRGVKFRFFHKVTNLGLSTDGKRIATIDIERQVELKDKTPGAEYRPLFNVNNLPCWPSRPLYDQIEDGDEMDRQQINLESMWVHWKKGPTKTLVEGDDFDLVVLGISLGGLPYIADELIKKRPEWEAMVQYMPTIATQAMQFWFNDDLKQLGWPAHTGVLTGYYEPLDTWSDMSFLLPREQWGAMAPKQISYFCSVFHPTEPAPPFGPNDYPARQIDAMKAAALPWINQHLTQLLPKTDGDGGTFDFRKLFHENASAGDQERFDAQYFRVNIDPSERYVQSVPGSTQYRLTADGSGFDNLFLAGDWLRTGINAGCVEAATMGGLQAARAISGRDIPIVGECDVSASPLAAQNADFPWSLAYARGDISSAIATLAVPSDELVKLLAPGLTLLPQRVTAAGTHPVGLIFAEQSGVRPNFAHVGGMVYRECAIAIPYVGLTKPSDNANRPFMFLPALYLDKFLPSLAGRVMYGYRKHLARVSGPAAQQDVAQLVNGAPVLRAQLHSDGNPGFAYDFGHLGVARAMMEQPVVTPDPLRGALYSFLDYQFDIARITPLCGSVDVASGILGNAAPRTWPVNSVRTAAMGAFQFDGSWTLTNPFESHALKEMIAAQRMKPKR